MEWNGMKEEEMDLIHGIMEGTSMDRTPDQLVYLVGQRTPTNSPIIQQRYMSTVVLAPPRIDLLGYWRRSAG